MVLKFNVYTVTVYTSDFPERAVTLDNIVASTRASARRKAIFETMGASPVYTGRIITKIRKTGETVL